jgi:hypothetical protein
MGERRLGRQATHDQVAGRRRLRHPVGADPAGIFRAHGDDDAQLGGDDVQPLAAILADLVHDTAAAGADQAGGFDDFFDARQPSGQIADGALRRGSGRPVADLGGTGFLLRLDLGQRDGQVFERQLPFIFRQLFRPLAVQGMVQFSDQMLLPPGDLRQRRHRFHQRLNCRALRGRDGGKVDGGGGLHGLELPQNPSKITPNQAVDSLCRSW